MSLVAPSASAHLELAAWRGLQRLHGVVAKRLDGELEAVHGLPLSSFEVLDELAEAPDQRLRMCDLAEAVGLSRSGLTRLADRLEAGGLICRACCPSDARGSYAVLTDAGRERLADARATYQAEVRQGLGEHLRPEDLERLADVWERLLPDSA